MAARLRRTGGLSLRARAITSEVVGSRQAGFFTEYNHVHHQSGIGWHTPASVHQGTYLAIDDARAITLNRAFEDHPERFARRPQPPKIRTEVWINEPQKEPTETTTTTTTKTI